MAASAFERAAHARMPGHRPDGLHPDVLGSIDLLLCVALGDLGLVADRRCIAAGV